MISKNNSLMLNMLADVLHDCTPAKVSENEWSEMIKELYIQAIYALPAEYISELGLSADAQIKYLAAVIKNRQVFYSLIQEQDKVLSILEDADIPVVVLKGAAAAISYSHPENRCMGDIDLLVMPQDFDRALNLFVDAGCKVIQNSPDYTRHVAMFTQNGIEIELHRYFSSSDNSEQNSLLDEMLYKAIPNRVHEDICGHSVSMLPPVENGLVLLGHINHHLSEGLGLRQIIDWMCYVEKYLDDELWENSFADRAEQIGMKRLAIITTAMCQKYLGLSKNIHWSCYEPVCDELLEYILSLGNFGRKKEQISRQTVSVLKRFRNPVHGLAAAQKAGLKNWQAAQKHRLLRPFAWCYQIGRWIKKGLKGGITIDTLSKASSSAKEDTELMKKLGVTRL